MSVEATTEARSVDATPAAPAVQLVGVRKSYGDVAAVDGVDLEIEAGEFFTMLGPSGSGKTTTLRLIAGFERPDEGHVELAGADVTNQPRHWQEIGRTAPIRIARTHQRQVLHAPRRGGIPRGGFVAEHALSLPLAQPGPAVEPQRRMPP